jgi:hypothetical protein
MTNYLTYKNLYIGLKAKLTIKSERVNEIVKITAIGKNIIYFDKPYEADNSLIFFDIFNHKFYNQNNKVAKLVKLINQ